MTERPEGIPRRAFMPEWTPAETAIYDAMQAVEQVGADVRLTDAVILLSKAQRLVADYVDDKAPARSAAPPLTPGAST